MSDTSVLIHDEKLIFDDEHILQMRIHKVKNRVLGSNHDLKYSLFYGNSSGRLLAYDNERGKGDHIHIGSQELPYTFTTVEALVSDFLNGVKSLRQSP